MRIGKWIKRKGMWLYGKIVREKATPEYIARGWAIGMFYGCLIPFGLQLACSLPTSFLLKGSKIGATLGTLLTNHVTIFFIYPAQCYVGNKIMGGNLTFAEVKELFKDVLELQNFSALWKIGQELVVAFFIGGAILTAVMTPITYYVVKYSVINYAKMKKAKLQAGNSPQQ